MAVQERWNHNNHYHDWLLRQLPERIDRALDVGCGYGFFATRLAERAPHVDAVDVDGVVLAEAARLNASRRITYLEGDFLRMGLPSAAYDAIVSIATLHHMDLEPAVKEMRRLLRPGGRLVVLDLYRESSPLDYAAAALAVPMNRLHRHVLGANRDGVSLEPPLREPSMPLRQVRQTVASVLPGARVTRRLYWRYSLVWRASAGRPDTPAGR